MSQESSTLHDLVTKFTPQTRKKIYLKKEDRKVLVHKLNDVLQRVNKGYVKRNEEDDWIACVPSLLYSELVRDFPNREDIEKMLARRRMVMDRIVKRKTRVGKHSHRNPLKTNYDIFASTFKINSESSQESQDQQQEQQRQEQQQQLQQNQQKQLQQNQQKQSRQKQLQQNQQKQSRQNQNELQDLRQQLQMQQQQLEQLQKYLQLPQQLPQQQYLQLPQQQYLQLPPQLQQILQYRPQQYMNTTFQ